MSAAFAEMPLAVFTTLGSAGAGAFIALMVAFFAGGLSDEQLKRSDKWALIPAIVAAVGFLASVFHLGDAGHMVGVLSGVGSSPLSNEVCVGVVFLVLAVVYAVLGFAGKLSDGVRKVLGIVVGVVAVIFVVFMGLAYMIPTIASWSSPMGIVQMCGYALVGGAAFLPLMTGAGESKSSLAGILGIVGAVLAIIGLVGIMGAAGGMSNATVVGAALVSSAQPFAFGGMACIVASAVLTFLAERRGTASLAWLALVLALVGILLARLAFYGMQISVGLSL